ncbi:MAG TPA: hypothetical protein VMG14_01045 [Thermoplasmata archaeon]|nr:hypothetical protein [Thermoplasmata archaeon]
MGVSAGAFVRDHWRGLALVTVLIGGSAAVGAYLLGQARAAGLAMTVDGSTDPGEEPCGSSHTLAAVGGTADGALEFVMSTTPSPSGVVDWPACPSCFAGSFDKNGNASIDIIFVTGASASTFYVAVHDLSSGEYSDWIPVTVLPSC